MKAKTPGMEMFVCHDWPVLRRLGEAANASFIRFPPVFILQMLVPQ